MKIRLRHLVTCLKRVKKTSEMMRSFDNICFIKSQNSARIKMLQNLEKRLWMIWLNVLEDRQITEAENLSRHYLLFILITGLKM